VLRPVLAAVATLAALGAAPAGAVGAPEASRGVRLAATIPERGVVSARAVGRHLYVSSVTGVTIFDIGDPQAPVRVGRLDLPNAQNEDVDVGSGLLLVSDDPFGGRGILHVVDVRDPTNPHVVGTYRTWARGLLTVSSRRDAPRRGGIGHTATCVQECRYAWLAGSPAGIDIVDLRDPARPRLLRRFAAREAAGGLGTHDVQVDPSGLVWIAGGRGTAAYDASNPRRPRLVKRTDRRGAQGPLNDVIHHNSLRLKPRVLAITEEDFADQCRGAGTLQTWRIRRGRLLRPLDSFGVERDGAARVMCSAHWFDARDGLIAQGFYEQGVRLIDVRDPRRLRQVGYYLSRPGLFWGAVFAPTDPTGSTVYALDHARGIDVLALDRAELKPVRRRGASRPLANPRTGFGMAIFDGFDAVRPGQRLAIGMLVFGRGGPVEVEATLAPELVDVEVPRGATFDPATRVVRFTLQRVRSLKRRTVRARVAPAAPLGAALEAIGYARGPNDPLPLDDRGVDISLVTRRPDRVLAGAAAAVARRWRGFCALPSDNTF